MKPRHTITSIALVMIAGSGAVAIQDADAQQQRRRKPDPEKVHDPSTVMKTDDIYRCFCTGRGITLLREQPDGRWLQEGRVFAEDSLPEWHRELVPSNRGHLWAPDIIPIDGSYYVYYSVSSFGKNDSAIGLAVGKTLDPESSDWGWDDRGPVVVSRKSDRFNAIDPALFKDEDGSIIMTFGSFWDGIHMIHVNPKTGLQREKDKHMPPVQLARSPEIEAPFLCKGSTGDYVLFLNWGRCCRGIESTYEIRVGRSKIIDGPYLDRDGQDMREGGGSLLLGNDDRYIGPGHPSILKRDGKEWLVHHFYDGENRGRSRLRMVPLTWDGDGWPTIQQRTTAQPE